MLRSRQVLPEASVRSACGTGSLRALFGRRWEELDLGQGFLEIRRTLQRVGGKLRAVTPKTFWSRRTVPLVEPCVDDLRQHRKRQDCERTLAGTDWKETG